MRLGLLGTGACVLGLIMMASVAAGPNLSVTGSNFNVAGALLTLIVLLVGTTIFLIGVGMLIIASIYRGQREEDTMEESSTETSKRGRRDN